MIVRRVLKAVDYIEIHLHDDFQLVKTSDAACYSHYHFLRIFLALTGMTVGSYIRRRRLSQAAEILLSKRTRIIEIAQDSGFESQAAFSRVFKDIFGIAPARFRREGKRSLHRGQTVLTEAYLQHLQTGGVTMNPRFEHKEAFTVIGLGKDCNFSEPNTIGALWDDFSRQKHRIKPSHDTAGYGVCYGAKEKETFAEKFHYTAAIGVSDDAPVPEGMEKIHISAHEYAVFTHKGRATDMQKTNDFIWKTWLPQSGLELADAPDFEVYGSRWDKKTSSGEVEIFVPIIR